jgi:triosephosphate isomerase
MTARLGTLSIDGTPISEADLARIEAEEKLHSQQQRSAVRVVASGAVDADDCRMLLSILGLDGATVAAARAEVARSAPTKRPRKRRAAA